MKVALCLSGHMRTYKKTYESWYNNVLEPLTPDVFIHTWSNVGEWTARSPDFTAHEDHGTVQLYDMSIDETDIKNKFQPVDLIVQTYDNMKSTFEEISKPIYEWRDTLPKLYHGYRVNSYISTFYKVWACNQKKMDKELIFPGSKYDMVIFARPDLSIEPLPEIDLNSIHIKPSAELANGWMWNIITISNSTNADLIANVYPEYTNKFLAAKESNSPHKFFEPHNLLYRHLVEDNKINIIDNVQCDIVR